MLRPSRQGCASWPPPDPRPHDLLPARAWPALARGRRVDGSFVAAAMADSLSSGSCGVQVLLDQQQSRIRWRVLLQPRPGATALVLFEKRGKGGRLLRSALQWP